MPLTWVEDNESRSATIVRLGRKASSSMTRSYKVFGTTNDVEVHADANDRISGLLRGWQYPGTNVQLMAESYSVSYLGDDAWQVTINYEKNGADDDEQDNPLRRSRSFDTTGGMQHITQAHDEKQFPVSSGNPFGNDFVLGAPPQFCAIGVDDNGVNGVDIVVPQLSWTETYDVKSTYVTSAYIKAVAELTGTTNNAAFRTFKAGEVLFLGASGSQEWDEQKGNGPWTLSFKFAASPNAGAGQTLPAITVGSITGIEKKGHEYMWIRYESSVNSSSLLKKPQAVYVNKVYRDGNFANLGIGTA